MKVFLDTTYLLPVIGIDVDLPKESLRKLFNAEFELIVNQISLFELLGKASKYFDKDDNILRFEFGMRSILSSDKLNIVPVMDVGSLELIRETCKFTRDLPDCVILASALQYADILLTEAEDILKLWKRVSKEINRDFEVLALYEFMRKYL
jgi:predicted nucleic acid-binding protein